MLTKFLYSEAGMAAVERHGIVKGISVLIQPRYNRCVLNFKVEFRKCLAFGERLCFYIPWKCKAIGSLVVNRDHI